MLKNLLVLENGQQISSGVGTQIAIQKLSLTECVNSGRELTLGSACASALEATLFTPDGCLLLSAGEQVTLYKVDDAGNRTKTGEYILEEVTRPSANTLKLIGYDRMVMLDKDLSQWLDSLTGWPYTLGDFADMVCTACGLELAVKDMCNGDFPVEKFSYPEVTGRQLMQWIGQIGCCFCKADADGKLQLRWYEDAALTIRPTGENRYYAQGLSYETYQVAPVDRVQVKLGDGAFWPEGEEGDNCYAISGNPLLLWEVSDGLLPYLQAIEERLKDFRYTPCTVRMPANLQISVGSLVQVADRNGQVITTCVMTKTGTAQREVLESTGSPRRDSTTATNNKNQADKLRQLQLAVRSLDGKKVVSLINLSEEGVRIKGDKIELEGVVTANNHFKVLEDGSIQAKAGNIAGWNIDENSFYHGNTFRTADCFLCTGSTASLSIGGSPKQSGWAFKAGDDFGVLNDGTVYAANANITGSVTSDNVNITGGVIVIPRSDDWDMDDYMKLCSLEKLSFGFGTAGLCVSDLNLQENTGCGFYILNNMMSFQWPGGGVPFLTVSGYDTAQPTFSLTGTWKLNSAPIITSDANAKHDIAPQPEVYSQVFDRLRPVVFRYNDGNSGRLHTGLIAQDVEAAVAECGLDTKDFAAFCQAGDHCGIRYEELISMLVYEVQKLKKQVARLEKNNVHKEEQ